MDVQIFRETSAPAAGRAVLCALLSLEVACGGSSWVRTDVADGDLAVSASRYSADESFAAVLGHLVDLRTGSGIAGWNAPLDFTPDTASMVCIDEGALQMRSIVRVGRLVAGQVRLEFDRQWRHTSTYTEPPAAWVQRAWSESQSMERLACGRTPEGRLWAQHYDDSSNPPLLTEWELDDPDPAEPPSDCEAMVVLLSDSDRATRTETNVAREGESCTHWVRRRSVEGGELERHSEFRECFTPNGGRTWTADFDGERDDFRLASVDGMDGSRQEIFSLGNGNLQIGALAPARHANDAQITRISLDPRYASTPVERVDTVARRFLRGEESAAVRAFLSPVNLGQRTYIVLYSEDCEAAVALAAEGVPSVPGGGE